MKKSRKFRQDYKYVHFQNKSKNWHLHHITWSPVENSFQEKLKLRPNCLVWQNFRSGVDLRSFGGIPVNKLSIIFKVFLFQKNHGNFCKIAELLFSTLFLIIFGPRKSDSSCEQIGLRNNSSRNQLRRSAVLMRLIKPKILSSWVEFGQGSAA